MVHKLVFYALTLSVAARGKRVLRGEVVSATRTSTSVVGCLICKLASCNVFLLLLFRMLSFIPHHYDSCFYLSEQGQRIAMEGDASSRTAGERAEETTESGGLVSELSSSRRSASIAAATECAIAATSERSRRKYIWDERMIGEKEEDLFGAASEEAASLRKKDVQYERETFAVRADHEKSWDPFVSEESTVEEEWKTKDGTTRSKRRRVKWNGAEAWGVIRCSAGCGRRADGCIVDLAGCRRPMLDHHEPPTWCSKSWLCRRCYVGGLRGNTNEMRIVCDKWYRCTRKNAEERVKKFNEIEERRQTREKYLRHAESEIQEKHFYYRLRDEAKSHPLRLEYESSNLPLE